ncbi:alanine racemase [Microcella flavibacter]|uniref:alanine racemase n=1 Tax=Microcella flavibacter TaxID=1804990 RepID=UPI0014578A9E|nr:alanine racemase [Microcella flavibacter]
MRDTPFLVVDVELLEQNLAGMAAHARRLGLALRPHAKTHKTVEIARRQLAHGAVGLTVATVAEAEIFADHGIDDLFIAYPVWAAGPRAERLRALADRVRLRVGVDSIEGVRMLAASRAVVTVAVEIDSGHARSGVAPAEAAAVASVALDAGLGVDGVFTFPGHSYAPDRRAAAAADEQRALQTARDGMLAQGIPCPLVSGGSTPSVEHTAPGLLTELRPGVYPLLDAQQWELGSADPGRIALTAHATVVSRRGRRVIVDAGNKALGADRLAFATGFGRLPDHPEARIVALSEHHATIELPETAAVPALGTVLRLAPNHVCSAMNLADRVVAVHPDGREEEWAVAARGANT